jgi:RNA polymerase sigma factor (TIGR02999 family)
MDVTGLVIDLQDGNRSVVDQLFPIVYDELRRIASRHLARERADHTLSTTALVHEAYIKLVDQSKAEWKSKAHFCGVAGIAMRRILIDYARRRVAQKRGGEQQPLSLDESRIAVDQQAEFLISLDEAMDRLARHNERLARVVESRFFGGLSEKEIAELLGTSVRTVRRDWVKARAWLFKELHAEER